jgi:hypothetical protein
MDDFVISNLHESRNEWCARLVSILTPLIIEGIRSIYNEAWKMCVDNEEVNKYLMTFQNMLGRVPKWSSAILEEERNRIIERSGCNYLEDLITCVHVIQMKVLTSVRVGTRKKKIDISIPKLDVFLHKVYVQAARKVYTNVYLFERGTSSLQTQRNNRELELLVQECIMNVIRESIPTETIIRAYLDESVEQDEEVVIEQIAEEPEVPVVESEKAPEAPVLSEKAMESIRETEPPSELPSITNVSDEPVISRLTFNNVDSHMTEYGTEETVEVPKTIENLERISEQRAEQRRLEEMMEEEDGSDERIKIHMTEPVELSGFDDLDAMKSGTNVEIDLGFEEL